MTIITELFTEKFRPKELNQLIVPTRIRSELSRGLIQNLLLYGSAGTGKTSALFILSKEHTTLYINASSERGIDIIRERISKFCSTISLEGGKEKLKCVILDEIDGATEEFFKALRAVMEKYANVARFIASCNFIQKIPDAIQSRFNCISFDPINSDEETLIFNEYKKRIVAILNAIKVTHTEENVNLFIKNDFPDMRTLLNKMQSFYLQGIKELNPKTFNINYDFKNLFDICLSKPEKPYEIYKLIISEYSSRIDESLSAIGNDFPTYLRDVAPQKINKLPLIIIATSKYQYQKQFVIDPIISLEALVFEIQNVINS